MSLFSTRDALRETHERWIRAESLLKTIAEEAEAMNAAIAEGRCGLIEARTRVQNIHGLAATLEVES